MFVFLMFLAVVIALWPTKEETPVESGMAKPKGLCPPHPWVYDENERIICSSCKMRPGSIKTDNGEY